MKKYNCQYCDKSYSRKQSRHYHIQTIHPEEAKMSNKCRTGEVITVEEEHPSLKEQHTPKNSLTIGLIHLILTQSSHESHAEKLRIDGLDWVSII